MEFERKSSMPLSFRRIVIDMNKVILKYCYALIQHGRISQARLVLSFSRWFTNRRKSGLVGDTDQSGSGRYSRFILCVHFPHMVHITQSNGLRIMLGMGCYRCFLSLSYVDCPPTARCSFFFPTSFRPQQTFCYDVGRSHSGPLQFAQGFLTDGTDVGNLLFSDAYSGCSYIELR